MRDRWPPQFFLSFTLAVAVAWAVNDSMFARASTSGSAAMAAIGQTEPPTGGQPANPDSGSSAVRPDSVSAVPRDTTSAAPPDTTSSAPDSVGVGVKPSQSALPDTLQFLPPPGSTTGGGGKPGVTDKPTAPKERTGILGIHPIVILLGVAVLNYFIIKAVTD